MNEMRIIVKNSDKLTSLLHGRKIVEEYLIYLLDGNTLVAAEVVYGDIDKDKHVRGLINKFGKGDEKYKDVVTTVSFTEYCKNLEMN
jgi:hypothetical protein